MKRILHDRKLNNVGMSLVEVVIAMAILSVVILGVLHSFVYSARLNARSRERQQTTAAAQTVMEYFKAYSVQSIYDDFVDSSFSLNGGNGISYTGTPGGAMTFDITGMSYENEPYDVKVSLSGHSSAAANVTTLNYETPTQEHAAVYVGYAGMDADALHGIASLVAQKWSDMESASSDPSATSAPTVSHHDYEVDSSKINITKRELKVDVSNTSGNYVATVSCTYSFTVNGYPYTKTDGTTDTFNYSDTYVVDLSGSSAEGHSLSKEIFNQSTALESLTLYYYPAYRYVPSSGDPSAPVRIGEDHIRINNSTGTRIKCYIYKQKNLAVSDSRLSTSENMYEVDLHLNNAMVYDDNLNTLLGGSDVDRIMDSKIHVHSTDPAKDIRYHGIGYAAANTNYPTTGNDSPAIPTPMPSSDSPVKPPSAYQQIMYAI
ncbi:MAG: hypothetical protein K2I21_11145, partial [Acetatifactor sp.]|nr:hypothetical protein [Acetatifactor sp.]